MCADEARLQQAWANAVEIAMDKVPERLQEVGLLRTSFLVCVPLWFMCYQ